MLFAGPAPQVRINRIRRQSPGMFSGNPTPPQDPTLAIASELVDSLAGDPGLRLWSTTGRRLFSAGTLYPQRTTPWADFGPNSPAALHTAPVSVNARGALNRFRGFAPGTAPKGL